MAYRYQSPTLNTFAEVDWLYHTVKPIISKNHRKEDDLRPIGSRGRKHERIIKVNDQKYILNDGECDTISFWKFYYSQPNNKLPTTQQIEALAPIVWSIDDEGNEFIKIRNGSGTQSHQTRYTFLENTLPQCMSFIITSGKQYIQVRSGVEPNSKLSEYFLPKSEYYWSNETSKDDFRQLHLTKPANSKFWLPQGNTFTFSPPKKRIDKKRKADLKDAIEGMWDYISAMWTLIDVVDGGYSWNKHQENKKEMDTHYHAWLGQPSENLTHWWDWKGKGDFIAHVFQTEDHPCRVTILDMFVYDSDLVNIKLGRLTNFDEREQLSRLRSQYNRWVNKALELDYIHSEKSIVEVKGER